MDASAQENKEWNKAVDAFWEYYEKGREAALIKQALKIRALADRIYPLPHRRSYFADHCVALALFENGKKDEAISKWLSLARILEEKEDTTYNLTKYSVYESLLYEVFLEDSNRIDSTAMIAAAYFKYAKANLTPADYHEEVLDVAMQLEEKVGIDAATALYKEAIAVKEKLTGPNQHGFALSMMETIDKYSNQPGYFLSYFASRPPMEMTSIQLNEGFRRFRSNFQADSILFYVIWRAESFLFIHGPESDSFFLAVQDLASIMSTFDFINKTAFVEHILSHQIRRLQETGRTGSPVYAHALYNLADGLPESRGQEAIDQLRNALTQFQGPGMTTAEFRISTLQAIAFRHNTLQQKDSAFQYMAASLELSALAHHKDSLAFLLDKRSYGHLCLNTGRLDEALKTFHEIWETYSKVYGHRQDDKMLYELASSIAITYGYKSQSAKEIEWFEKCDEWLKRNNLNYSGNSDFLYNLNRLFFAYLAIGDSKTAKFYLDQQEKFTGDNATTFDKGLLTHAQFQYYFRNNNFKETLKYIPALIAGDLANYAAEKDWVMFTNLTNTYEQVAEVYFKLKQPDSIYRIFAELTAIAKERNSTPNSNKMVAQYHYLKGNRDSAIYHFSKDLLTGTNDQNYGKATQRNRLGMTYWHFNDLQKADSLLTLSIGQILRFVVDNFSGLSEKERLMYTGRLKEYLHKYHNFLLHLPEQQGSSLTAYELIQQSKGLLLQSSAFIQKEIKAKGSDDAKQIFAALTEARKNLARSYQLPHAPVDSLQAVVSLLERRLSSQSSAFQNYLSSIETGFTDIRNQLKENQAVIEFVAYPWFDGEDFKDSVLLTAYVIRQGYPEPVQVNLGNDQTARRFVAMQQHLQTSRGGTSSRRPGSFPADSVVQKLYEQLWKPLDNLLSGTETIFISPDGIINKLSFAAVKDGEGKYLSDRFEFRYVLSGKEIVNRNQESGMIEKSIMLFGAADFDLGIPKKEPATNAATRPISERSRWQYLPGTLSEVLIIDSLARKNNWKVFPNLLAQATESRFTLETQSAAPSILHVATHGFYFPGDATPSANHYFQKASDPLARCGIIFSGANHAWMGGSVALDQEDGILTGMELATLDLSNTALVILSACETGIGEIVDGEGVYGLQRALKQAGVKNMVLSLWPVPDKETSEMMQEFYTQLTNDQTINMAFRLAQNAMKEKYKEQPGLWGAFVLIE